VEWEQC
jgi:hypothetical protein